MQHTIRKTFCKTYYVKTYVKLKLIIQTYVTKLKKYQNFIRIHKNFILIHLINSNYFKMSFKNKTIKA